MECYFIIIQVLVLIITSSSILYFKLFTINIDYLWLELIFYLVLLVIMVTQHLVLRYFMFKLVNYEYIRTKMATHLTMALYIISILLFSLYTMFFQEIEKTLKFPFYEEREYCEKEDYSDGRIIFNLSVLLLDR